MANGMPNLSDRISLVWTARITGLEKIRLTFSLARDSASLFACIRPRSVSGCFQPLLEKMPSTLASDWAWRTKNNRNIAFLNLHSRGVEKVWKVLPKHTGRIDILTQPGKD